MKIAIDCMGNDNGVEVMVQGAVTEALKHKDLELILVGNENKIKNVISNMEIDNLLITIHNTTQVIKNEEQPIMAVRQKKDSSMVVAARMVKNKEADAFITSGSTGAYLTSGLLILGRISGIRRPALSAIIPSDLLSGGRESLLLDCGANMDATSDDLLNYAIMGDVYSSALMGRNSPSISLLNVGTEESKGNKLTKEAFKKLSESDINFAGNIEARTLLHGQTDVIICDGFSGNIAIKTFEGAANVLMKKLKETLMGSFSSKLGAILLKNDLQNMKNELDYNKYGGGLLLGLKGLAIKCHGNSTQLAIEVATKQTYDMIKKNILTTITKRLETKIEKGS